jgi:hypothetical protein
MPGALISNLSHFLDERGNIAPANGPARRIADHLIRIVAEVTGNLDADDGLFTGIPCRRRPARKPCKGLVQATFSDMDTIAWWCGQCGDNGLITGWEDTLWDLSDAPEIRT